MDLMARVIQKNEQVSLQNVVLQQHLCARVNISGFSSFLVTFTVAPFIIGAVVQRTFRPKTATRQRLWHFALPVLRLWSLL
jgi:hypothetical protein